MKFNQVILCTEAPTMQGLAYYYFLAFQDIIGKEKVHIVDENREYSISLIDKIIHKIKSIFGFYSRWKYKNIWEICSKEEMNVVMLFNNAALRINEINRLSNNSNIFLVNYLSDSLYGMHPNRRNEIISSLNLFDLVLTFAEDLIPVLYQMGAKKVRRIPFGYCKYNHLYANISDNIAYNKLYYFGTWTPTIELWLSYLTHFDLVIEGFGWHNAQNNILKQLGTKSSPKIGNEMSNLANVAGVIINFTRANHGCFHTMKTFELTAAGACVISNYSREQEEFFLKDHSMIYFNTPGEMQEKVEYYLTNVVENNKIRKEALKVVLPHSYHNRVLELMEILKNY